MEQIKVEAVLTGQREYKSKKGEQKYQYSFIAGGLSFDMQGDKNLKADISDVSGGKLNRGELVFELAVYQAKPYLKFVDFQV